MAALPNRTQPSDFFRRYAKEHKLTDRTIKVLQEEDCDQAEVIHFLDRQYIDQLNITVGQKIRMGNIFKKNQKNEVESDPAQVDWTNAKRPSPSRGDTRAEERAPTKRPSYSKEDTFAEEHGMDKPGNYPDKINIAVVGLGSSGKSSLINAVRGLSKRDALATKVGFGSTLKIPAKNIVPGDQRRLLWELPAQTRMTPEYVKMVQFEQYDGVFLCCNSLLCDYDLALARECHEVGIPCTVIRCNIDKDIEGDIDDHGDDHVEESLLGRIKNELQLQLQDKKMSFEICLTSNKSTRKWEFNRVLEIFNGIQLRRNKVLNSTDIAALPEKPLAPIRRVSEPTACVVKAKAGHDGVDLPGQTASVVKREKLGQIKERLMNEIDNESWHVIDTIDVGHIYTVISQYIEKFHISDKYIREMCANDLEALMVKLTSVESSTHSKKKGKQDSPEMVEKKKEIIRNAKVDDLLSRVLRKCYTVALGKLNK